MNITPRRPRWARGGSVMHLQTGSSGNTPAPYRGGRAHSGTPGGRWKDAGRTPGTPGEKRVFPGRFHPR